jgi:hypothetical protein
MRSNLLATAIAASLGFAGLATTDVAHAQSASDIAELKAQIAALQARVDQLETQTDAQSDVNVAQAKANESFADVDNLKKLVNDTQISGRLYYDLTNINKQVGGAKVDPSGTNFDIKRFYLGVDHKFNDTWAMNLTTDFQYNATLGASELYIKKAYIEGKFSPLFTVRAGANDMPWIPYAENIYGYRYVDKTITDQLGQGTSSDWGLHAFGKSSAGVFNYAAAVVNGNGYKAAPDNGVNNRSKGVDFEGRIGFQPINGLDIGVGVYSGKKGKDTYANDASTTNEVNTASRTNAIVAYANSKFRIGAEWFQAKDYANPFMPIGATDLKEDGYSIFGNVALTGTGVNLFARYDKANLNKDAAFDPEYTFYNLGVEFPVVKGVKIAPVYKYTKQEGATATAAKTETKEFGVFGEFRF